MIKDLVQFASKEKLPFCGKLLQTEKERIAFARNYSLQVN